MDMEPELAREWIAAARSLQGTMERFQAQLPHRRATDGLQGHARTGDVSVRVAGDKTPWLVHISVTSAVLCMVLSIITLLGGGMLYLNMKDHLDAIYMMAPQLKPEQAAHEHHHPDPAAEKYHRLDHSLDISGAGYRSAGSAGTGSRSTFGFGGKPLDW